MLKSESVTVRLFLRINLTNIPKNGKMYQMNLIRALATTLWARLHTR